MVILTFLAGTLPKTWGHYDAKFVSGATEPYLMLRKSFYHFNCTMRGCSLDKMPPTLHQDGADAVVMHLPKDYTCQCKINIFNLSL